VSLEDVVIALAAAAELPLSGSPWFDLPGPEVMSGRELLQRIAALQDRRILQLELPLLTPRLSALWLRLIARTDFSLAKELVVGLQHDLLPHDDRFWRLIGHTVLVPFDEAARRALAKEPMPRGLRERLASVEERFAALAAPRLRHA
jgi:hypothetical protein